MDPNADAYRALARSSPWRRRTAHFTYTDGHALELHEVDTDLSAVLGP